MLFFRGQRNNEARFTGHSLYACTYKILYSLGSRSHKRNKNVKRKLYEQLHPTCIGAIGIKVDTEELS